MPEDGRRPIGVPLALAILGAATGYLAGDRLGLAWGFFAGIVLAAFVGAAVRRHEADAVTGPRITVGVSVIGALIGLVLGLIVGTIVLNAAHGRADTEGQAAWSLAGGGLGWVVACVISVAAFGRDVPPPDPSETWTMRAVGIAVVIVGIGAAAFERSPLDPFGVSAAQTLTVIDAVIVGGTLVVTAGWRGRAARRTPGPGRSRLNGLVDTGVVAGCVLVILGAPIALGVRQAGMSARTDRRIRIEQRANDRTSQSLANAASHYEEAHGVFPPDLATLIAAGGKLQPGSHVNFVGLVPDGFCVRVGTENGTDHGGPPYSSWVVYPKPPHQDTWAGGEGSATDTCRSGHGGIMHCGVFVPDPAANYIDTEAPCPRAMPSTSANR
jgi:hypothetical protein